MTSSHRRHQNELAKNVAIKIVQEVLSGSSANRLARIVEKWNVVGATVNTLKRHVQLAGTCTTKSLNDIMCAHWRRRILAEFLFFYFMLSLFKGISIFHLCTRLLLM